MIFIPYVLADETILAEVDGSRGTLVEVLTPSPDRIPSFCRYFSHCGGCAVQTLATDSMHAGSAILSPQRCGGQASPSRSRRSSMRMARDAAVRRFTRAIPMAAPKPDSPRRARITSSKSMPARCSPLRWAGVARGPRLAQALAGSGKPLDILVTATASGLDVDLKGHGPLSEAETQKLVGIARAYDLARVSNHGLSADLPPRTAACHGKGHSGAAAWRFLAGHAARRGNARGESMRPCCRSKTHRRSFFRHRDLCAADGGIRQGRCLRSRGGGAAGFGESRAWRRPTPR